MSRPSPPPPGPPPPPPPLPEEFEYPLEVINPPPQRLTLMDSIRKSGGMGRYDLKSARARKLAEPKNLPPGAGGLMGDLKASLRGRGRGGIGLGRGALRPSGRGLRK